MASNSRDKILGKLRAARAPFTDVPAQGTRITVTDLPDTSPALLRTRFIKEAKTVAATVHETSSDSDAVEIIMDLLGDDKAAMTWDAQHIPINGLEEALTAAGVTRVPIRDSEVRVGITGADAALAATGSVVVESGSGKSRQASLLPLIHIAVVKEAQILPDLEAYYAGKAADDHTANSNIAVITGPSKSADIAQTLIHGMHGPGEIHIVLVP